MHEDVTHAHEHTHEHAHEHGHLRTREHTTTARRLIMVMPGDMAIMTTTTPITKTKNVRMTIDRTVTTAKIRQQVMHGNSSRFTARKS